ncbi:FapA family protein [bacterium]|nr:FapA family protein [bacterium]
MDEGYLRLSHADSQDEEVLIRLARQNTQCFMSARILKHHYRLTPDHLKEILLSKKIVYGIDEDSLKTICEHANSGKPVQNSLVASGKQSIGGQDGCFDYAIKPFSIVPEYDESRNGRIDFHETNLFENVITGQTIGKLIPPQPGEEGITVLGDKIQISKVKKCSIHAGQGIDCDDTHSLFTANKNGRVMLKFNTLQVTEELVVEKDVDFKIGHIDFVGFVQIRCDVLEGFHVRAKKGLQIAGNVSNSRIDSDGDITLGGMSSREGEGVIHCGGNLKAAYLCNVQVECEGDVQITKEAVNCVLACNGTLTVGGRIVGGSYTALGGLEAAQIGTELGVKTFITCGDNFHFLNDIVSLKNQIREVKNKHQHAEKKFEHEFGDIDIATLPEDLQTRHETALQFLKKLDQKKRTTQESLQHIRKTSQKKANPKINITEKIHAGTHFTLDCTQEDIKEEKTGPFSVIAAQDQSMAYLSLSPLAINARTLKPDVNPADISTPADDESSAA